MRRKEGGDRRSEGIALGNLGNPHFEKGDFEQAMDYYAKALELHREIGNRRSEGVTLSNMAYQYHGHGMMDESRQCSIQALEIHSETGNRRLEANTLTLLALIETESGNREKVLDYYGRLLSIVEEFHLSEKSFDNFDELYAKMMELDINPEQAPRPSNWTKGTHAI